MTEDFLTIKQSLERYGVRKTFKSGTTLHFQDEPVDDIFFVLTGKAAAHVLEPNGKEVCMDNYRAGDLIGLEYIRRYGSSQCQVSARGRISVLQFRRNIFVELSETHAEIGQYVLEQFSNRLRKFQEGHIESQILSKRGRVASEIRRLATPDTKSDQSYIVTPKPVISDIAARLGIARETVSRTVNDLIKDQVLERNCNAFYVPDLSLLEAEMR